jgi:hypothetical protein
MNQTKRLRKITISRKSSVDAGALSRRNFSNLQSLWIKGTIKLPGM